MVSETDGRVLVVCASRSRPDSLRKMLDSVARTATCADVAVYVDREQEADYADVAKDPGVEFNYGERIGPVGSLNYLVRDRKHAVFAAVTDDCELTTPGWDEWLLQTARDHPVSVMAPFVQGSPGSMDFPAATAAWVKSLGYFALPEVYHSYWDLAMQDIAEATNTEHRARQDQWEIVHNDERHTDRGMVEILKDSKAYCVWRIRDKRRQVAQLKRGMEVLWTPSAG